MSIINTQGGIGTAFIWWTNFVNWAVQGSAESWWRLNDPSLAEHLGTCLTLITACSTDFTAPKLLCWNPAPWLRSCLSSLTCKLWQIKGKTSWKRLWPSGCLSYPCDGDYSSARQVNEWLLKHIKLKLETKYSKLESWAVQKLPPELCRCLCCGRMTAAIRGWWGRWSRAWNHFGHRIWTPRCSQTRALSAIPDSLAVCSVLLGLSCLQLCPVPEQQFQLESPARRDCTFRGFGAAYCEYHQNRTNNFPNLHVTRVHLSNVQHSVHKPCLYLLTQSCLLQYFQINGGFLDDSSW